MIAFDTNHSDYLIHSVAESEGLKLETFDKKLRKELN